MHDYQPLVSRALSLLFRHFNQRKETLQHLNQVQLLVSETDIKNYKQIKRDLDQLRLFVEKSELWVYKKGKDGLLTSASLHETQAEQDDRKDEEYEIKVKSSLVLSRFSNSFSFLSQEIGEFIGLKRH